LIAKAMAATKSEIGLKTRAMLIRSRNIIRGPREKQIFWMTKGFDVFESCFCQSDQEFEGRLRLRETSRGTIVVRSEIIDSSRVEYHF